ncbi:MAG TPA: GNAT family N-acetyltransferase [Gammaproteobacteria bacterium]|nr:GNAT family N-acetyltransferase [Gammaproteobacteria bacterium]
MQIAQSDEQITHCFSVLSELRPRLDRTSFITTIRAMQEEGFVLVYLEHGGEVVSVAGYRIYLNLAMGGQTLYVYDLVTGEKHRSKGFGAQLLADLESVARAAQCKRVHLDSHMTRHRAHKFYLTHGFDIVAHHFVKGLE